MRKLDLVSPVLKSEVPTALCAARHPLNVGLLVSRTLFPPLLAGLQWWTRKETWLRSTRSATSSASNQAICWTEGFLVLPAALYPHSVGRKKEWDNLLTCGLLRWKFYLENRKGGEFGFGGSIYFISIYRKGISAEEPKMRFARIWRFFPFIM